MKEPLFYPRAQITGILRWACPFCARINLHHLKPTAYKLTCKNCNHKFWHGSVFHSPGQNATVAQDATIPVWADDEYSFDPIKFDPMPEALYAGKIKQRGRVHMLIQHVKDNFFVSPSPLPVSPEEAESVSEPEAELEEDYSQ